VKPEYKRRESEKRKRFSDLTDNEFKVLNYFMNNISVGEILAVRELESLFGLKDPKRIIESLIEKGYIERGNGCYNLSKAKFPRD
jgi:DNA-binding MarR family transcriptional regulator